MGQVTDLRGVPHHMSTCSAYKMGGNSMASLLNNRLGISQSNSMCCISCLSWGLFLSLSFSPSLCYFIFNYSSCYFILIIILVFSQPTSFLTCTHPVLSLNLLGAGGLSKQLCDVLLLAGIKPQHKFILVTLTSAFLFIL